MNRFPIYVPSKGRAGRAPTVAALDAAGLLFSLVVEPAEVEAYRAAFPTARLLVLPADGRGLPYARNFIRGHARDRGARRHWQIDDNIPRFRRTLPDGKRAICSPGPALVALEDLVDSYRNVGVAGFPNCAWSARRPIVLNRSIASCVLVSNDLPFGWRSGTYEDADLALQVVASGRVTLLFGLYSIQKLQKGTLPGGQAGAYAGDGRLKLIRALERAWPGLVTVSRRFGKPSCAVRALPGRLEPVEAAAP